MLIETAKSYWLVAQRIHRAPSAASRRLIVDHEVLPTLRATQHTAIRNRLSLLVAEGEMSQRPVA